MAKVLWTQKQDVGPSARGAHALAYDAARQQVVMFGGRPAGGVPQSDTWTWNGLDWTQVADMGPDARGGHALAFDLNRGRVLLFGGQASGPALRGDTWEWDGAFWTQAADTGPDARARHAIAFDSARQRAVLFGGEASGALRGDTWEWDGAQWTQVADTGPEPRGDHAVCFDAGRGRVVLFGGEAAGPARRADTWEWDGATWTQVADTGPAPTRAPAMAFTGAATLLFGGVATTPTATDEPSRLSWEWDGAGWTLRQNMGPRPRWAHALALDADRGAVVLFGGLAAPPADPGAADSVLGDTWEAPFPKPAPGLISFTVTPDTIPAGVPGPQPLALQIAIDRPAPPAGFTVDVTYDGPGIPSVSVGPVVIPPGETAATQSFDVGGMLPVVDIVVQGHVGSGVVFAVVHVVATP